MLRKNGISTLIACQNEEATVGLSLLSFLPFSDEIIVVDNGSTDGSTRICRAVAGQYPDKVQFYDAPHLKDLYENRQYAFDRSQYRWIVRADADYVCYTDGPYDCRLLREHLISRPRLGRPQVYRVPQPNLHGDFWHTSTVDDKDHGRKCRTVSEAGRLLRQITPPMARIFEYVRGMRFVRRGRWEGVSYPSLLRRLIRYLDWKAPIWMHCNVKSDFNYFMRTERTNWRQLGNFELYPTLSDYVKRKVAAEYGTDDIDVAIGVYMTKRFLPTLSLVDKSSIEYPTLLSRVMETHPIYRIVQDNGHYRREHYGSIPFAVLKSAAMSIGLHG